MTPARGQTQTTRSGVERTNHEATAPPYLQQERQIQFMRGRLQHITDTMQIHVLQLHFRA